MKLRFALILVAFAAANNIDTGDFDVDPNNVKEAMQLLKDLGIETPELDNLTVDQIQEKLKGIVPTEEELEGLQQKAIESLSD